MPTPSTTEGMPSPSAAMAAVGVRSAAGTAALAAISRGVPRSCACGAGALRKAMLHRSAMHAAIATQRVIRVDERAMAGSSGCRLRQRSLFL